MRRKLLLLIPCLLAGITTTAEFVWAGCKASPSLHATISTWQSEKSYFEFLPKFSDKAILEPHTLSVWKTEFKKPLVAIDPQQRVVNTYTVNSDVDGVFWIYTSVVTALGEKAEVYKLTKDENAKVILIFISKTEKVSDAEIVIDGGSVRFKSNLGPGEYIRGTKNHAWILIKPNGEEVWGDRFTINGQEEITPDGLPYDNRTITIYKNGRLLTTVSLSEYLN